MYFKVKVYYIRVLMYLKSLHLYPPIYISIENMLRVIRVPILLSINLYFILHLNNLI